MGCSRGASVHVDAAVHFLAGMQTPQQGDVRAYLSMRKRTVIKTDA
jgi:hypothetical protein